MPRSQAADRMLDSSRAQQYPPLDEKGPFKIPIACQRFRWAQLDGGLIEEIRPGESSGFHPARSTGLVLRPPRRNAHRDSRRDSMARSWTGWKRSVTSIPQVKTNSITL